MPSDIAEGLEFARPDVMFSGHKNMSWIYHIISYHINCDSFCIRLHCVSIDDLFALVFFSLASVLLADEPHEPL